MKNKWKVFLAITLSLLAATIALVHIAATSTPPTNSNIFIEITKTVFLCLGGLSVILTLYLSVTNAMEGRSFQKIENTFNLITRWDDPHLLKARSYTRKIGKIRSATSDEQLLKEIKEDEELEQSVILLVNYFEHVRLSILLDRVERDHFTRSHGQTIIRIIDRFEPYYKVQNIEVMRDLNELKFLLTN